uniref:HRDC domain-containing protein n=1 Tax=Thiobacillus sp. TaxID=924 RepID=UPI0025E6860D
VSRETADEKGVPAYVILYDATLHDIVARRLATLAELGKISGLGTKKLEAYGEAVLGVVAEG